MFSFIPIPGNPWPHDMAITVEDSPHQALELLWIREVWQLNPVGDDLPPLLVSSPPPADGGDMSPEMLAERMLDWSRGWPHQWDAVIRHYADRPGPSDFDSLRALPPGSPQYAAQLQRIVGPSWSDRFGGVGFDDSWHRWTQEHSETQRAGLRLPLAEHPERRSLAALIPAWRGGLTTIVTIPCRDDYTRTIGPHTLLTTDATRADPARYSAALDSFASTPEV